ncbi:NADH-quinone oxidoreductase subunit NuoH [Dehalococcoides mccartyi]|uniref:NADH-quinone oxidoreductase subunit NuoH n=1 Tax=Dehalococcoides mccartyi TaxID=61435 RepID=UPI0006BCD8D6|nr:NADH-quinone oxidoreductase subunit NuoH [Dehalococcoides mccartyi]BAS31880.1 NADH dehydrogenase (quinone) [Dehalococcoides mccartyi IBARAKI]BEL00934.1 NADH-quinone oxidoreductase subunit NuoH [Dehalococcoides mccartyi]
MSDFWIHLLVYLVILFGFVIVSVLIFIWLERRLIGRFQLRPGPNRAGPFGLLQPIADAIKVLIKEDIIPSEADKGVFWLAPLVAFVPVMLMFAAIPFADGVMLVDLNIGILYILAVSSVTVIGIFMAGWSSNSKYSLLGAMRTIAQEVSYEIPLVLSILGVVMLTGSLSMNEIVKAQDVPFILLQPLGFFVYLSAAMAEVNRTPFDLLEAESEIIAGFHTEYSGMKFGLFYLMEYAEVLAVSAIATTLFLGGWQGPLLHPVFWFIAKVLLVFMFIIWVRATLPRLRIDQVMAFGWKFLLPLSLANLVITAFEILIAPDINTAVLIGINIAVMFGLVLLFSRFYKLGGGRVSIK